MALPCDERLVPAEPNARPILLGATRMDVSNSNLDGPTTAVGLSDHVSVCLRSDSGLGLNR